MENTKKILNKYIEKLNYEYIKANTKSKRKNLVYDLLLFSNLYNELYFETDTDLIWENDEDLITLIKDNRKIFINNVLSNQAIYNKITNSTIKIYKESDFKFYTNYGKKYHRLSDSQFDDIILSFLESINPTIANNFNKKIKENEIFKIDQDEFLGATFPISILKKNIILFGLNNNNKTIFEAYILAHELGHDYELNVLNNSGFSNSYQKMTETPFFEVASSFFEYSFIEYLLKNKIITNDSQLLLSDYLKEILIDACNISILSKINPSNLDEYGNIELNNPIISNYANDLIEEFNIYNINNYINYKDAYIYEFGRLFAIYLYQNFCSNPKEFLKEFNYSLLEYQTTNSINSFNRIGISEDILTKGDALKKVLKRQISINK